MHTSYFIVIHGFSLSSLLDPRLFEGESLAYSSFCCFFAVVVGGGIPSCNAMPIGGVQNICLKNQLMTLSLYQ